MFQFYFNSDCSGIDWAKAKFEQRSCERELWGGGDFKSRLACVAGGIVGAHEIKFWRRSREDNGEGGFEIFLAASPLASSGSAAKLYFARAYNTASYAG